MANTINALFLNELEESELAAIVEKMKIEDIIVAENENVGYKPPIRQE